MPHPLRKPAVIVCTFHWSCKGPVCGVLFGGWMVLEVFVALFRAQGRSMTPWQFIDLEASGGIGALMGMKRSGATWARYVGSRRDGEPNGCPQFCGGYLRWLRSRPLCTPCCWNRGAELEGRFLPWGQLLRGLGKLCTWRRTCATGEQSSRNSD